MKIEGVELTNMRTFASANWKVPTGLSLITGENGSGKSTLLGIATAWIIWGQTPGRSQDYLVRHGEREMSGQIIFRSGEKHYAIRRRFRLNKNGKGGVTQLLFNGGDGDQSDLTGATVRDTQAMINTVAGSFEVWQMTAYVGQRQGAGQFLEANAYERKGILREIIAGVGDWDEWESRAKLSVKDWAEQVFKSMGAIPVIEEAAEPLASVTEKLEITRNSGVATLSAWIVAEADVTAKQKLYDDAAAYLVRWGEKDRAHKLYSKQLTAAANTKSRIETDIQKQRRYGDQFDHIQADYEAHQVKIAARQTEIDKARAENELRQAEDQKLYSIHEIAMADWQVEVWDWGRKRDARMNEIRDRFVVLKKVKIASESLESKFCPECKQELTDEHADELKTLIAANSGWESEMAGLNTEYGDIASEKSPEKPEAPKLNVSDDVPLALGQDERIIELRTRSQSAAEFILRLQDELEELATLRQESEETFMDIDKWLEKNAKPSDIDVLRNDVELAEGVVRSAHEALEISNRNITLGEEAVRQTTDARKKLSEMRNQLGDEKVQLAEWEAVVQMCGTNGVRQLIIDQSLSALEPACNRWLGIIAPGFEIAFSTQTETDRETFDEGIIMPNGTIQPWSELSGAQSVAVALAVRLGLAEVGGAAQGIHYETLYLDEADAWLTGDYQQQFMDMLARVADTGIDVVAITHIEAVKEMIDQQTEVVANGDGTSEIRQ